MRFTLMLAVLLCFATWMSMVYATHGPVSNCCLQRSNTLSKVPFEQIVDYTNQSEGVCPIRAVVFQTKRGKRICSDPDSDRAKRAMRRVDKEKEKKALQKKGQHEGESTTNITPPVSSASTNVPPVSSASTNAPPVSSASTNAPTVSSASTNAPPVSSASKNAPRKKHRNRRKCQKKKSLRNWQRKRG
ncbi:lymphotactin-like isoform X2 [Plectropomus leopardus]|uniref:lymphotactin-like isoform X2 n=1 Tax=Plectropomus leopardus TaxID=160734 RepID=UPI001C4A7CA7|nr:lymphotactin-like isoform X2 [Plectropomus leopardus]